MLIGLALVTLPLPGAAAWAADPPRLTVIAPALNVRGGPGTDYPVLDTLAAGAEVAVTGQHPASGWWQVSLSDGRSGWVSGGQEYVRLSGDPTGLPVIAGEPAAVSGAARQPAPPSGSGTLVFQTETGGAIYAVDLDGSHLRYLTSGFDPVLSPDGRQIAFTRWNNDQDGALGNVWLINIDGSGERAVLDDVRQPKAPTWSPDGSRLAVGMQEGGWVDKIKKCVGFDGNQRPPVPPNAYDVKTKRRGNDRVLCYDLDPNPYWGLRMVDLTSGAYSDLPRDSHSSAPTWNAVQPSLLVSRGDRGLVGLDIAQGKTWQLTADLGDHAPVFSPDGNRLAVSYWQHDHWEIHVMNADGSGRVRLTEMSLRALAEQMSKTDQAVANWNNVAPAWSPDGSRIAFLTDRSSSWQIWVMQADGSQQRPMLPDAVNAQIQITSVAADARALSWR
jgi:TolB protein